MVGTSDAASHCLKLGPALFFASALPITCLAGARFVQVMDLQSCGCSTLMSPRSLGNVYCLCISDSRKEAHKAPKSYLQLES